MLFIVENNKNIVMYQCKFNFITVKNFEMIVKTLKDPKNKHIYQFNVDEKYPKEYYSIQDINLLRLQVYQLYNHPILPKKELDIGYVYGVDTVAKKIWRVKGQEIEILSDFKVNKFLIVI